MYSNNKETISELVTLLDSEYDWTANLCLYSITQTNAVMLQLYSPQRFMSWREEMKEQDVAMWKAYLKKL
jgi:hypothetical protein